MINNPGETLFRDDVFSSATYRIYKRHDLIEDITSIVRSAEQVSLVAAERVHREEVITRSSRVSNSGVTGEGSSGAPAALRVLLAEVTLVVKHHPAVDQKVSVLLHPLFNSPPSFILLH